MVVNIETTILWDETPRSLAGGFQHLSGTCRLREGRGSRFLQNMGTRLPNYMVLQPISQEY
jgi:hypothetical protein